MTTAELIARLDHAAVMARVLSQLQHPDEPLPADIANQAAELDEQLLARVRTVAADPPNAAAQAATPFVPRRIAAGGLDRNGRP